VLYNISLTNNLPASIAASSVCFLLNSSNFLVTSSLKIISSRSTSAYWTTSPSSDSTITGMPLVVTSSNFSSTSSRWCLFLCKAPSGMTFTLPPSLYIPAKVSVY